MENCRFFQKKKQKQSDGECKAYVTESNKTNQAQNQKPDTLRVKLLIAKPKPSGASKHCSNILFTKMGNNLSLLDKYLISYN
jgi:hypothetical protein